MNNFVAKDLLGQLEGNRLTSYQDSGGIWTIGRGSTKGVGPNMTITPEQSDERFDADIAETRKTVDSVLASVGLNDNQYSAFVLFAFNVKGWLHKPITAYLIAKDFEKVAAHWVLYDKAEVDGAKIEIPGLLDRRKKELNLFLSPVV